MKQRKGGDQPPKITAADEKILDKVWARERKRK
jgi:hypothetical protein